MFCSKCGAYNTQDAQFCGSCGEAVVGNSNTVSNDNFFGQQSPQVPTGVIATRSGVLMYQVVLNAIIFPISILLTLVMFFTDQLAVFLFFLFLDFVSLVLPIYFLINFFLTPKERIVYDGNSLKLNITRSQTVTVSPNDIINVFHRRSSGFLVGMFFLQDGKITIDTRQGSYTLRFVRQVAQVEMVLAGFRQQQVDIYFP
ncbi:MAG: zinc-ribbon domain-containing protein [Firmicutes bacterium]|nr:zinc-ribbon domain-containing protein [Bacillota bacterium]